MCPKVEIRCLGDDYGKVIEGELVSVNRHSVSVRFPEGTIMKFSSVSGFADNIIDDSEHEDSYEGFQINLKDLIFDKSLEYHEFDDMVKPKNKNGISVPISEND